jgi:hypothetical protein
MVTQHRVTAPMCYCPCLAPAQSIVLLNFLFLFGLFHNACGLLEMTIYTCFRTWAPIKETLSLSRWLPWFYERTVDED